MGARRAGRASLALVVAVLVVVIGVVVMCLLWLIGPTAGADRAAFVERNNHAVGLMGRYDYEAARRIFAELAQERLAGADVRVNLAIATLNRQGEGDTEAALAILQEVLVEEPDHLRARYCTGLLTLYLGSPDDALGHFRLVADADSADAYAAYYVAACFAQGQEHEQALAWYERARELDPYLQSAVYGLAQTYQRLGRAEDAEVMAAEFERLRGNPRARLVDFRYTRMGPKADTLAIDLLPRPAVAPVSGPIFADGAPLATLPAGARWLRPSVTAADVDADGDIDLLLTGLVTNADAPPRAVPALLLRQPDGSFASGDHPATADPDVNTALWGDVDNDGLVDLYLCRRGPNALWRQTAPGTWEDVTAEAGAAGAALDTVDGALVDADHDGDLDVLCANADGPDALLSNNLDGTFRDIAAQAGVDGGDAPSRRILVGDVDADRDLDLVVVRAEPPHAVFLNDLLWTYRPAPGADAFLSASILTACLADLDADGRPSVCAVAADGALRSWSVGPDGAWRSRAEGTVPPPGERAALAVLDVDGDFGDLEWIVGGDGGWRLLDDLGSVRQRSEGDFAALAPVALERGRGHSLVGVPLRGDPVLWRPGPGRHPFVDLEFSGRVDDADGMRSNASGIGVEVAVRLDSTWLVFTTVRAGGGPGQSLQPWPVGLAGGRSLDFVRLEWPDGVLQTEVHGVAAAADQPDRDFSAGRRERVAEIQRQKSSCPVLFAWNGEAFGFVTDVLGVGGIGYMVAPGEYAPPRPWERLVLPAGAVAPRGEAIELKLSEPMEEACYLDAARLVAWDLPAGWNLVTDDRMAIAGPEPTGAARLYRRSATPVRAINDRGADVTALVAEADLRAAPVGPLDARFLGRLAGEHVLELTFAAPLDEPAGDPMLVVDGWVEYPYSQTMFAAWQAGADYRAPTLEAAGADGRWTVVLEQFGYPAGMPRQMSVPLAGLPAGTTRLRLRTNQEVYWDRILVAWSEPCPEAVRRDLPLRDATLARSGFAVRTTGPQRLPHYDYARRPPFWDSRHQRGLYTAFGPVTPLVGRTDDAVAIFGPGEEVHLRFAAPGRTLPPGWTRRLVLEVDGWCKDMDLYTRDGATVAPLPARGGPSAAVEALHERFNTRYVEGH
ncbi:MAG: FG-GAP-like repeat-containing protein [Planctomycetota bacterium]|jgi:Flp pilus assembly protein TadD